MLCGNKIGVALKSGSCVHIVTPSHMAVGSNLFLIKATVAEGNIVTIWVAKIRNNSPVGSTM